MSEGAAPPQCVILAGGLATRLGARAQSLPKALVPIAGRPFADLQLSWLGAEGVTEVVYCIGHRADQIRAYVGCGERWRLAVSYVDEGQDLRGTGGALRLALDQGVLAETFAVLYGDSYLRLDLRDVYAAFRSSGRPALMTVLKNDDRWDRSNAQFENGLVTRYAKGASDDLRWIDYGLSILTREAVGRIPSEQRADLADLLGDLSAERQLAGYEASERFYEIGSPEGLAELERHLGSA